MRYRVFSWLLGVAVLCGAAPMLYAQGLTGQIAGSVVDSSGSVLPGATVTVKNTGTQISRETTTDESGAFVVTDLLAGTYEVTVALNSFKTAVQTGVVLSATERLGLRPIVLEVGALSETVSVQAEAARVQTNSAERSGLISQEQIKEVALKGRDYMGHLRLMPGVVDTANREAPGWNNLGGLSINGGRVNTINLTYDGVTNLDTGSNTGPFLAPGLDSIAEIKVLTSNYQAEYGRSSGGTINVITKSGSREFRGGGFYSKRHESFNANEWFNNKLNRPKPIYRFDYLGYNIGGPVILPGFNSDRSKLFFFFNQEFLPRTNPGNLERRTMPTALERQGDFSQSFDSTGALIVIRDPQTGQPFPGNRIPANRIDANGQAMLNLFPLPNLTGDPQANYTFQSEYEQPRNDQVVRVDWNIGPNTNFYSRVNWGYEAYKGGWGFVLNNANWPQLPIAYEIHSYGVVNTLLHTFSPTLVAEVTVGLNHGKQTVEPLTEADRDRNDRNNVGLGGLPSFFPAANPDRIVPNANFGAAGLNLANMRHAGRRGALPVLRRERHLEHVDEHDQDRRLAQPQGRRVHRVHDAPGGAVDGVQRRVQLRPQYRQPARHQPSVRQRHPGVGQLLLGSHRPPGRQLAVHATSSGSSRTAGASSATSRSTPASASTTSGRRRAGATSCPCSCPSSSTPAQAPLLIQPVSTPSGRRGLNPLTGEILPAVKIGTYVPGSGNPSNGVQLYDEGILDTPSIQVAPRIGVSWDVTGDGRTAIRGGFGMFPDRFNDDIVLQHVELPPLVNTPTANYTTIPELLSTPLSLSPATARTLYADYNPQYTYNYSIGVQRDLGFKFVGDLAYVGSKGRRLLQTRNINAVPYGANFLPSSIDPTTGQPLPANFLRPYRGYGDILVSEFAGFSDYDALQAGLTRRYTQGLRFGLAYTLAFAKNVGGTTGTTNPTVNPFLDVRDRNYRDVGRRHNLAVNYSYDIPGIGWDNAIAQAILDNWQISGVTSALSGETLAIGYSIAGVERPDRRRRRRRRLARRHHLRPEPVARRSLAGAGLRHRVHRAAVSGHQPHRHRDQRRDHRPRLSQLGHLARQGDPDRRHAARDLPRRGVQRLQHACSSRPSTPRRTSRPPACCRRRPSSASTPAPARPGACS